MQRVLAFDLARAAVRPKAVANQRALLHAVPTITADVLDLDTTRPGEPIECTFTPLTHRARPIASHLNASSRTTPRRAALAPHRNESCRAAYRTAPERIPPHRTAPRPGRDALVGPISRNWVYQRRHTIHDNISSSSDN